MDAVGIVETLEAIGAPTDRIHVYSENVSTCCFPAGTPVLTSDGCKPIEAIVVGDRVITVQHGFQPVIALHQHQFSGRVTDVRVRGLNMGLTGTADHRTFVVRGAHVQRARWRANNQQYAAYGHATVAFETLPVSEELAGLGGLEAEDLLRLPSYAPSPATHVEIPVERYRSTITMPKGGSRTSKVKIPTSIPITTDLAELLGLWLAEGSAVGISNAERGPCSSLFSFKNGEPSVARCVSLLESVFGLRAHVQTLPDRHSQYVTFHDSILARWFLDIMGRGAQNKRVPDFIFSAPLDVVQAIIAGLKAGDGYRYLGKNKRAGRWDSISTTSETLSFQLPILLGYLGIKCRRTFRKARVDKHGVNHRNSWEVCWSLSQKATAGRLIDGAIRYPVRSVASRLVAELPVYNMTVAVDESYTVGPISVKNCPLAPWNHPDGVDRHPGCSVQINPDGPSMFKCWSASCGAQGLFRRLVMETWSNLGRPSELLNVISRTMQVEQVSLEREFEVAGQQFKPRPTAEQRADDIESKMEVWDEREAVDFTNAGPPPQFFRPRLETEDAQKWNVGFDAPNNRITFPIRRHGDSALVGLVGRNLSPDQDKYYNYWGFKKSKFLYGENFVPEKPAGLVLVEGIFDTILMSKFLKMNPTYEKMFPLGCFGTSLSDKQAEKILSFMCPIYLFFDGDESGDKMLDQAIDSLAGRVRVVCSVKTPRKKDPGDLSPEEIFKLLDDSELVRPR